MTMKHICIYTVCVYYSNNNNNNVYMNSSDTDIQKRGIVSFKLKSFILKSHFILTFLYKKSFIL